MTTTSRIAVVIGCLMASFMLVIVGAELGLAAPAHAETTDSSSEESSPEPSPSPTSEPSPEPEPSPSPTSEPSPEPEPSPSPTSEPSPEPEPSPSPTSKPSPEPEPEPSPTATSEPSPDPAPSPTETVAPSPEPSPTETSEPDDGPTEQVYEPTGGASRGVIVEIDEEIGGVPEDQEVPEGADGGFLQNDTINPEALGLPSSVPQTADEDTSEELTADPVVESVIDRLPMGFLAGIMGLIALGAAAGTGWAVRRNWTDWP